MQTEEKNEGTLILSETSLANLPAAKFRLDSWIFNDDFMFYCAGVFAATLSNLAKDGYLKIEPGKDPVKFLGALLFHRNKYLVTLVKKSPGNSLIGWLEECIFKCLLFTRFQSLDDLAYDVFNEIFKEDKKLINPGKVFFLELLRNQRMGLFEFAEKKSWPTASIKVWQTKKTIQLPNSFATANISNILRETEVKKLRRVIAIQLRRFQHLDS